MKKHILGVALFTLIVTSFAIIYAFFYSPSLLPREAVKPPVPQTEPRAEKPTSCYPRRVREFSYTVESSSYLAEKNVLTSEITLYWNGSGAPPKKISVQPRFFTTEESANPKAAAGVIVEPFKNGNTRRITLETRFALETRNGVAPNLYVVFDVLNEDTGAFLTNEKAGLAEASHVLYVYPEKVRVVEVKPVTGGLIRGTRDIPEN